MTASSKGLSDFPKYCSGDIRLFFALLIAPCTAFGLNRLIGSS